MDSRFCAVCANPILGGHCANCAQKSQREAAEREKQRQADRNAKALREQREAEQKKAEQDAAQRKKQEKAARKKKAKQAATSTKPSKTDGTDWATMISIAFALAIVAATHYYVFPRLGLFQQENRLIALGITGVIAFIAAKVSSPLRKLSWLALLAAALYFGYTLFIKP